MEKNDESLSFHKPKQHSKSSLMWNYFKIVVINNVKQDMLNTIGPVKVILLIQTQLFNQTQVTEYYSSSKSHGISKKFKEKVKLACTEFVALDSRAFELVSGDGFFKMAQSVFDAGKYFNASSNIDVKELIPSPITISRNIDNLYEIKNNQLKNICTSLKSFCIICDFWTEQYTGLSYCGLALRFITTDYKLHNFILGCILYDVETQSATNIRMFIDAQLLSYGLSLKNKIFVVSDNENKMRAAFKEKCIRIGCSIHYLNKQLEHSFTSSEIDKKPVRCDKIQDLFENVKKIVTHVRRSHRQVKLKQKLQLYSDTRFNGAFYMLNVFLNVYDDLNGVLNSVHMDYLSNVDKELLEEICGFLKTFDEAINQLSEEERPTIYKVLPIRQALLNHCQVTHKNSSELKELKSFLVDRIKMVWVLQDQHFMSTLLHPSLKHFHIAPNKQKKAFDLVKQELLERAWISDGATDTASKAITTAISNKRRTTPTVNSNDLLTRCFDKPQPKPISTPTPVTELDNYMALDEIIDETEDVLLFWKRHAQSFPTLSIIVRDLFSISSFKHHR
ncbi:unnamed protein product [Rotaria socialis]|uniref:Transposase n=1 Tax=Rotaria socialis TaxID=392032 RepID=A0A818QX35_9BILA|nr:unnamed protein product [Rotaria socialis]